jgi:hypothetical protein
MIRTFGIVGAAILAITVILTLWSISTNAQLTLSSNVSGIKNATHGQEGQAIYPKVAITSPTKNSSLPVGVTLVSGNSSAPPGGNAIKVVEVHVDNHAYSTATPKVTGNWSNWSIKLNIPNNAPIGPHVIQARATDAAGNRNWYSLSVNFNGANVNASSMPASSNVTAPVHPLTNVTAPVHPTNATATAAVSPTASNKTAAVPSYVKHKTIHPSAFPGIIPPPQVSNSTPPQVSNSTPPTGPAPSSAHECPNGSVADANASCPP